MNVEEYKQLVEEPFNVPDLAMLWPEILNTYKEMGFAVPLTDMEKGTPLSDNEMIREFQWIYGQYRKYIGTKRTQLLSMRDDLDKMLMNIKQLIEKDSETPDERPKLIYQCFRNQWLLNTWNHIAWMIEQQKEENDERSE